MNSNFSTPPRTRAEAEEIVKTTIAELNAAIDAGVAEVEILVDQYTRVLSARLWHDVQRWRVAELADESIAPNPHQSYIGALTHDLLAWKAWPAERVSA